MVREIEREGGRESIALCTLSSDLPPTGTCDTRMEGCHAVKEGGDEELFEIDTNMSTEATVLWPIRRGLNGTGLSPGPLTAS